jgi:proteasome lid subunit RPN8/RPN11
LTITPEPPILEVAVLTQGKEVVLMDLPEVYIEKEPFLNMVVAALETGKRECLGIVCGRKPGRNRNYFHITNAAGFGCVRRRSNTEVEQSKLGFKNIAPLFTSDSPLQLLGDFHSHPEWGGHRRSSELSEHDIRHMIDDEDDLGIVILRSSVVKDRGPWEALSDGSVRGFITKKNVSLHAYMLVQEDGEKKSLKLRINAPDAIRALNKFKTS